MRVCCACARAACAEVLLCALPCTRPLMCARAVRDLLRAGRAAEAVQVFEGLQGLEGGDAAALGTEPSALLAHAHALQAVGAH